MFEISILNVHILNEYLTLNICLIKTLFLYNIEQFSDEIP